MTQEERAEEKKGFREREQESETDVTKPSGRGG